jgi:DNA modification methylase
MRLIHGDCLEAMAQLVADGLKVDAIITDPPYGTTACKWDSVIPFNKMWPLLNALIKPKGAIVLFGSEPFSSALRMSNIKNYKYDWIWEKEQGLGMARANYMPMVKTENITIFNSAIYNPIMVERLKPIKITSTHPKVIDTCPIKNLKTFSRISTHTYPINIIYFCRDRKIGIRGAHPTQKPVALMEYLIKTYTLESETVLDFTMGSGSTGVACQNTNRDFIGIELDDKYFDIASRRIKEATGLFGGDDGNA